MSEKSGMQAFCNDESHVIFELNADDFEFNEDEVITPGFEIGIDVWSGSPVCLKCWGKVAGVCYSPMNHSYRVMIEMIPRQGSIGKSDRKGFVAALSAGGSQI